LGNQSVQSFEKGKKKFHEKIFFLKSEATQKKMLDPFFMEIIFLYLFSYPTEPFYIVLIEFFSEKYVRFLP